MHAYRDLAEVFTTRWQFKALVHEPPPDVLLPYPAEGA